MRGRLAIPACAGQPVHQCIRLNHKGAYPRVCGATQPLWLWPPWSSGLSPRVRGNPAIVAVAALVVGPIPACAGQPAARPVDNLQARAYPRVCGATFSKYAVMVPEQGLSPRVRGNPRRSRSNNPAPGPIPACAGQPWTAIGPALKSRAYPRVCGATCTTRQISPLLLGLSPRVRGNRDSVIRGGLRSRPIPACAGQPESTSSTSAPSRAYPRVCGATGMPKELLALV